MLLTGIYQLLIRFESAILRLAVYEFIHHPEIPYRVILNEAVELAKSFGGEQGYKYINGVLDKVGAKITCR